MAADLGAINAGILNSINEITRVIIGAGMKVSNELGAGFIEKVYERALALQIGKAGLEARRQAPISVSYENEILGVYVADILVEGMVIVEVKALPALHSAHRYQCINYLKATGLPVCLLMNFGRRRLEFQRFANTCGREAPERVRPVP